MITATVLCMAQRMTQNTPRQISKRPLEKTGAGVLFALEGYGPAHSVRMATKTNRSPRKMPGDSRGFNIFRRFRITQLETAECPKALQHFWSGHAKSHVSEVYKKLLKRREWRLRWTEKAGTGFTLPGHQEAAAEVPNGKSGKILEFRKVG